jgi:pyrroloquinoline quinone biosynthesis protein D
MALAPSSVPRLWRLARLDFDSVRQQPVLLYPEGAVLLNATGAAILELCDGRRSVEAIAKILEERYQCQDLLADVTEYLSALSDRELIRDA